MKLGGVLLRIMIVCLCVKEMIERVYQTQSRNVSQNNWAKKEKEKKKKQKMKIYLVCIQHSLKGNKWQKRLFPEFSENGASQVDLMTHHCVLV